MSAASPGVIAVFLQNQHYDSHEDVRRGARRRDEARVRRDPPGRDRAPARLPRPGDDAPDAMDETLEDFRAPRARERRGAQPRDRATSRPRTCACTSAGATTRARTTTTSRCATSSTSSSRRGPAAISFEAANPRHEHEWNVFEDVKLPEGKVLIPGVLDSTTNYIEHPELIAQRLVRYGRLVGPRERDGRQRLRLRDVREPPDGRPGDHLGEAARRWPRAPSWRRRSSTDGVATLSEVMFGFPNPVNEKAARVVAGRRRAPGPRDPARRARTGCSSPLAYGFWARVLTGPTLSPLGRVAMRVVAPRLGPPKYVRRAAEALRAGDGRGRSRRPPRCSRSASAPTPPPTSSSRPLVVAATLESVFALCLGCQIFGAADARRPRAGGDVRALREHLGAARGRPPLKAGDRLGILGTAQPWGRQASTWSIRRGGRESRFRAAS